MQDSTIELRLICFGLELALQLQPDFDRFEGMCDCDCAARCDAASYEGSNGGRHGGMYTDLYWWMRRARYWRETGVTRPCRQRRVDPREISRRVEVLEVHGIVDYVGKMSNAMRCVSRELAAISISTL